jgi:anti-anti-sigma factor
MTDSHELAIEGELSIYRAAELRQWLDAALQAGQTVRIRLADVSEMDTAGAQLLLAAKRLAQQRGCTLSFTDHSPPVLEMLELLNLAAALGDPIVMPAAA